MHFLTLRKQELHHCCCQEGKVLQCEGTKSAEGATPWLSFNFLLFNDNYIQGIIFNCFLFHFPRWVWNLGSRQEQQGWDSKHRKKSAAASRNRQIWKRRKFFRCWKFIFRCCKFIFKSWKFIFRHWKFIFRHWKLIFSTLKSRLFRLTTSSSFSRRFLFCEKRNKILGLGSEMSF